MGISLAHYEVLGVGYAAASSALTYALTGISLELCAGAGSAVGQLTQAPKKAVISTAMRRLPKSLGIREILCALGGFEIAMMAGAILRAAERRMTIVIDDFITSVAALIASRLQSYTLDYCIFSDISDARGYQSLLASMEVRALLPLSLNRGEALATTVA